jgi:hypothetical protein
VRAPLPPLPPAFGVTDAEARPGGRSVIDILVDDHHQLAALCDLLVGAVPRRDLATTGPRRDVPAAGPPRRRAVTEVLVATLSRHLSAEEQYLYPTVRAVLPGGALVAERELVEDAGMLHALKRLHGTAPDDPSFPRLALAVAGRVRQHAHRAGREVLPRLREACGRNELIRLGNRVTIALEAAPTRPHPATPLTPPANKLVDPAVAVLDKLRDVVSRRPTRTDSLEI